MNETKTHINDGGPAFPVPLTFNPHDGSPCNTGQYWDGKARPTLKRVLSDSVAHAFALGMETGRREAQGAIKKALGLA